MVWKSAHVISNILVYLPSWKDMLIIIIDVIISKYNKRILVIIMISDAH